MIFGLHRQKWANRWSTGQSYIEPELGFALQNCCKSKAQFWAKLTYIYLRGVVQFLVCTAKNGQIAEALINLRHWLPSITSLLVPMKANYLDPTTWTMGARCTRSGLKLLLAICVKTAARRRALVSRSFQEVSRSFKVKKLSRSFKKFRETFQRFKALFETL